MVYDTSWWRAWFGREVLGTFRVKISQKTVTIRQRGAVAKPRVSHKKNSHHVEIY
jgi:hypothetical protein